MRELQTLKLIGKVVSAHWQQMNLHHSGAKFNAATHVLVTDKVRGNHEFIATMLNCRFHQTKWLKERKRLTKSNCPTSFNKVVSARWRQMNYQHSGTKLITTTCELVEETKTI